MPLRDKLNKSPALVAFAVIVLLAVCGWVMWGQVNGSSGAKVPNAFYYTVDEGQTLFTDSLDKLPPFDHEGKQAVRAHVYRCPDGTQVVGYLERYTEKGKAVFEKYQAEQKATPGKPPASLGDMIAVGRSAKEIKRPGDKQWVNISSGAEMGFASVKCKDDSAAPEAQP